MISRQGRCYTSPLYKTVYMWALAGLTAAARKLTEETPAAAVVAARRPTPSLGESSARLRAKRRSAVPGTQHSRLTDHLVLLGVQPSLVLPAQATAAWH